jgi:hypothetical protein
MSFKMLRLRLQGVSFFGDPVPDVGRAVDEPDTERFAACEKYHRIPAGERDVPQIEDDSIAGFCIQERLQFRNRLRIQCAAHGEDDVGRPFGWLDSERQVAFS